MNIRMIIARSKMMRISDLLFHINDIQRDLPAAAFYDSWDGGKRVDKLTLEQRIYKRRLQILIIAAKA